MKNSYTLFKKKTKLLLKIFLLTLLISVSASWAQTPIFNSSMAISIFGDVNSPGNEQYGNIIDGNINSKFLDFLANDGMGFTVNLGGASQAASSIAITTANDSPSRDPQNYEVLGSNDGSNFISVGSGVIQCISTRFFTRTFAFANSTAYKYYRVNFTNTCGDSMFQLAEVQLYTCGTAIGGVVSANQSIAGLVSSTPSGEANLNSGTFAQITPETFNYECVGGYFQNCIWDGEQEICYEEYNPCYDMYQIFTPGHNASQSFKTSNNVTLNAIKINVADVLNGGSYNLRIFQGEGDYGTELMNQAVSISNSGTNTFVLNNALSLIGNQSYTFRIESNDGYASFNWTSSSDSDYSRGKGYTDGNNNNADFNFQLVYLNNVNWQNVTLSGFTGGIQKWQKSTDINFSNPIDIASTSTTLDASLVGDVFQTTYFRAVVVGCSTVYSDYVTITVNSLTTSIKASQCGTTLAAMNSQIAADVIPGAQMYRFEVTNGANVRTFETTKRNFDLTKIADSAYGTTYAIKVAVKVNNTWGVYGTSCNISTPALTASIIPVTKLRASQCGTTLATIGSPIHSELVYGAEAYRFQLTNGATVTEVESPIYYFFLTNTTIGTYGTTFSIKTRAKIDGVWGNYGTACAISTPALSANIVPTTQIKPSFCGTTLAALNTKIPALTVYNAEGYRFEITSNGTTVEYNSPVYNFKLSQTGITVASGTAYSIRVAAKVNGVYGNYGIACTVTTPGGSDSSRQIMEGNTDFSLIAYPNPSYSDFKLQVNGASDEAVSILVFDMTGRQIENKEVNASAIENITIGQNYSAGIYNVIVSQGKNTKTVRLVKN